MKIAGFELGKKHFIIIGVVILVIALLCLTSSYKDKKEKERILAEAEAQEKAQEAAENVEVDEEELEQQAFIKKWGEPPEGFKWDDDGELVPISSDKLNAEDVVYTYVRALSILDFSTARKMAEKSVVEDNYTNKYSEEDVGDTNYYSDFLRKQYKFALTTLELVSIDDIAVFADGTKYVTATINALDLTDKDFWQKDKDELYKAMRVFSQTETDSVKMDKYLYDYLYESYVNGKVGKKSYTVEFVVTKENQAGWLITDDTELHSILAYTEGLDVAMYIKECYYDWLDETMDAEEDAREEQEKLAEEQAELESETMEGE